MYAFAPLSLAALHKVDGNRPRTYRVPLPSIVLPAAFCSANLIIYWGGYDSTLKLVGAMVAGLALFAAGAWWSGTKQQTLRNSLWIWPWLAGHVVIGILGRYGGGRNILPDWTDIAVVVLFSLTIFYSAIALTLSKEAAAAALEKDTQQL